jgi:hypothetical protein
LRGKPDQSCKFVFSSTGHPLTQLLFIIFATVVFSRRSFLTVVPFSPLSFLPLLSLISHRRRSFLAVVINLSLPSFFSYRFSLLAVVILSHHHRSFLAVVPFSPSSFLPTAVFNLSPSSFLSRCHCSFSLSPFLPTAGKLVFSSTGYLLTQPLFIIFATIVLLLSSFFSRRRSSFPAVVILSRCRHSFSTSFVFSRRRSSFPAVAPLSSSLLSRRRHSFHPRHQSLAVVVPSTCHRSLPSPLSLPIM